jgi:nitroreductase
MHVAEAVRSRRSVRAFLDRPIPADILRHVIAEAARSPSGGNLQPWRLFVLAGEPLVEFKALMQKRLAANPEPVAAEYSIYPNALPEAYRAERDRLAKAMYELAGIGRDQKLQRLMLMQRNFSFFGAPAGLFCYVDRCMGPPQWSDLGMYLQTLMLLLRGHGIDSCAQEAWSLFHDSVGEFLGPPPEWMLFCGMAIGYADPASPMDSLRSERMPVDGFAKFMGLP